MEHWVNVLFGDGRWEYLWHGLEVTLLLAIFSTILGVIIGVVVALMRQSVWQPFGWLSKLPFLKRFAEARPVAALAQGYISLIRGTPILVQLLIMYYVVFGPYQNVPKLLVASLAFGINSGAYVAEIIRSGLESLDKGQMEAARSLGLSRWQAMRYVLLPQGLRNSLPSLINEFITLVKETSVVGWIGVNDLMRGADNIRFQTATAFESLFMAALMYLTLTWIFTKVMVRVERRLKESD